MRWLVAAVLAGLLLACAGPASALVVGVGEQHSTMFKSRPWKRLGLRDARYITPWDVLQDPGQLALLDTWMAAAKKAHVRVLLGFAHSMRSQQLARQLPSTRAFTREFRALRRRYPRVRDWVPWNEANNPGAITARRPRRVAQYFDVVAANCRGCRVVAADVIDTRNMTSWVAAFKRYVHHRPRIWGLHNYSDTNGFKTRSTLSLLAMTRGQIWFTETGGVVLRRIYRGRKVLHTYRYGTRHAALATAQAFRLACLSRRIARLYVYDWEAPRKVTTWDSGLLDARGRVRPAYGTVRRWVQHRSVC